ncbi:MAG: hypothetical protein RH949_08335 [Coleofasciculus sp. A1-SPW-01]|uniref:N-acetyltransferase family protein n=1 Tax=Coleofasciculus sp. A1-SPW-01 TaxID=3070819 RepID=UPI0032F38E7F
MMTKTQSYSHRLATQEDAPAIAKLWAAFVQERAAADPSMVIKPNFNFTEYITHQLNQSNSFCWVIEYAAETESSQPSENQKSIVGVLFTYVYDESPPPNLPQDLHQSPDQDNPFIPRRVGSVLGFYIQPEHRQAEAIKHLIESGLQQAETFKINDIDLLVSAEQTGIHALLQRLGFTKAAVQYTKHYDIPADAELPSLHPPHPEFSDLELPEPNAIPLRDPNTNELIYNSQGQPVFLYPLKDEQNQMLRTAEGMPIYPTPVRDPQKNDWVFDDNGKLVICPVLRDENSSVVEYQGIPQFHPPAYDYIQGSVRLKQDASNNYVFCDVERDKAGKILYDPSGKPIFKQMN